MEKLIVVDSGELKQILKEALAHLSPSAKQKDGQPPEDLLTREQLAKRLDISLVTLHDWMKKGLPYKRLFKRIYFNYEEVLGFMKHINQKDHYGNHQQS